MTATHLLTKHIPVRIWAFANDFMVFTSSAIVTGILSYFINEFSLRNAHIIYQEVIVSSLFISSCVTDIYRRS